MTTKAPRKLILRRETLRVLQATELTDINGGTTPATVATPWTPEIVGAAEATYIASVRYCQQVAQFSLQQANRGFEGINKAWETAKKVGGWVWNHL